jgi:hypothetical protein
MTKLPRVTPVATLHEQKGISFGRGQTKGIVNRNATAISEKSRRFQAGNWFPS